MLSPALKSWEPERDYIRLRSVGNRNICGMQLFCKGGAPHLAN